MTSPENPIEIEELPVSLTAQDILHEVHNAPYRSTLRKLGGRSLFHAVRSGEITPEEQTTIMDEINAKRALLTTPAAQLAHDASRETTPADDWSPTAGMTSDGVERERDWFERAYKDD